MSFLHRYLAAVQSFTGVAPGAVAAGRVNGERAELPQTVFFPGVGWLTGLLACTVFALLGLALPDGPYAPLVAAVGCTAATIWFTRGLHEKALARSVDRLCLAAAGTVEAGHAPGAPLGVDGTLTLGLALAGKLSLLAVLAGQSPAAVLAGLLAAQVVSRFWPLVIARTLAPRDDMAGRPSHLLTHSLPHRELGLAFLWCLPPLAMAWWAEGWLFALLGLTASGASAWAARRLLQRKLRSVDGMALEGAQQVGEIGFYLGAAIALTLG